VAAAAVFPSWAPLNNAILHIPRDAATRAAAELTGVYAKTSAGVWAFWVPSTTADLGAADDG
jgi:hypothetical protein